MSGQVQLTDLSMQMLGMGKVFKDNSARINSVDFHRSEDYLVTGGDDDSIHMYNTAEGQLLDTFFSKKYGVSNICMTHASSCVLYATRKAPPNSQDASWYSLRYHDLQRNEYIRYFRGHTAPITTVAISPKSDMFMSTSQDKTMRLWDLRSTQCHGVLQTPGVPCAGFDEQGLVFAVGTESGVIKLYDSRSFDKGPFDTFVVQDEVTTPSPFTHIRFSNDGKLILGALEGRVYVLDAFQGSVVHRLATGQSEGAPAMEAAFSPDNQYLISGCEDRTLRVWSMQTGSEVATLPGHAGVPSCVKFAPRRLLIASACQSLALWIAPLSALQGMQRPG